MGRFGIMGTGHTTAEVLSRATNVTRGFALRSSSRNNAKASVRAAPVLAKDIDDAMISAFDGIVRSSQK